MFRVQMRFLLPAKAFFHTKFITSPTKLWILFTIYLMFTLNGIKQIAYRPVHTLYTVYWTEVEVYALFPD